MNRSEQLRQWRTDVARLDQDWELEREPYLNSTRLGVGREPTKVMSLLGGAAIVAFGVLWLMVTQPHGEASWIPCVGILLIVAGMSLGLYWFNLATAYQQAHQNYQLRRARLLAEKGRYLV